MNNKAVYGIEITNIITINAVTLAFDDWRAMYVHGNCYL